MRIAAKIAFIILSFTALGFCVAFVMEELLSRSKQSVEKQISNETSERTVRLEASRNGQMDTWGKDLVEEALEEIDFTDKILAESGETGALMLEFSMKELSVDELQNHFVELMARDLDDYRAVAYAGRVLREISERSPELGVTLLYALTPAEKEKLVPSLANGWVVNDAGSAFDWIESAWVDADGEFIDRTLQNDLYIHAMDTLIKSVRDYNFAASILEGVMEPDLKERLVEIVARSVVLDGPENALDRIAAEESGVFDIAVMDAIAEEWAARDGVGAMQWTLSNQEDMSSSGVRSIAKQLILNAQDGSLATFHGELQEVDKRDTVAAEAARLNARRNPILSADWALAIQQPSAKRAAVYDALYEIGYDSFGQSVDYIDYVYAASEPDRAPVLYSALKDWVVVDRDSVVEFLISDRANLSDDLSEDILLTN